jgi:zinc transport system substrate-binding protein
MNAKPLLPVLLLLLALLAGPAQAASQAAPAAFVTVAPQKYFVDKVSGGTVPVSVMVAPGSNPHAYEPRPRQMAELAKADIYFAIDDAFDRTWLKRIMAANPKIVVVNTAEGVAKIPVPEHHHHEEDGHGHDAEKHGEDGHDEEGALDPHIWLDPALVRIQVGHIRDGLTRVDPERAALYAANAESFLLELQELDREIRAVLDQLPQDRRTFLVFHPSWGYFAKAYGLTQAAIEVGGKEPSPREMAQIIAMGKKTGARVVFTQPQFSEKSARTIAAQIGATVLPLDDLSPDWADNMRKAARAFADALR